MYVIAYRACPWCIWEGEHIAESSKQAIYFRPGPKDMGSLGICQPGDACLKLTHGNMIRRGELGQEAYCRSEAQIRSNRTYDARTTYLVVIQ